MKRLSFLFIIPAVMTFASCGGGDSTDETNSDSTETASAEVDYTGMKSYDLTPNGIKTTIMVPEELSSTGEPYPVEVERDDDMLTWDIIVGNNYDLVIEEPDGEGKYMEREKERLKNDDVFTETFIVDEPTVMLYKASLPEGAGQRDYYHIFGTATINGIEYLIKSNMMGEFSEVQAQDMLKSYRSLTEKAGA